MPLTISRILHAGYLFENDDVKIVFDPIFENPFSRNCYAFPAVEFDDRYIAELTVDAVFISHFHDDHCSLESLNKLNKNTTIYFFCVHDELFAMIRALGFKNVFSLELNKTITVGSFKVTPWPALDQDVDSIFQVAVAGKNILNVVDSWIDYETLDLLKQQPKWDLILWPFQTMREMEVLSPSRALPSTGHLPEEWLEQLKILNPQCVVPSSCQFIHEPWSWYNHAFFPISYAGFEKQIHEILPHTQVVRMDPSRSFRFQNETMIPAGSLPWINPIEKQIVDYDYQPSLIPPATNEIAQNFPALSHDQTKLVWEYCQQHLLAAYRQLYFDDETYFTKPRHWRLSLYDHTGKETQFHYNLQANHIELTTAGDNPLSWTTQVPLFKLHAALTSGESLTSMYVRINDHTFPAHTEKELTNTDFLTDPLIRCLFSNTVGSYQKDQLNRIQKNK